MIQTMIQFVLCASLAWMQPFSAPLEEAFLDAIDRGTIADPPRLPVFEDGDITYTPFGDPVYDDGVSLWSMRSDEVFHGRFAREVAQFIMDQDGVRIAIAGADSQWSGGPKRLTSGIARTWPVTWSRWWAPPTASDPWFWARTQRVSDYLLSSSWANPYVESNIGGRTLDSIYRAHGILNPSMIPMPYGWIEGGTDPAFGAITGSGLYAPHNDWYDPENWGNGDARVILGFRQWFLSGGESDLVERARFKLEYFPRPGRAHSTLYDAIHDTTVLEHTHSLGDKNRNVLLSYADSPTVSHTLTDVSFRPRSTVAEFDEDFFGEEFFTIGGAVSRFTPQGEPEDNISLCLVRYASGQNPCVWIHDAEIANSQTENHGADHATRAFMYEGAFSPNVLVFSFGHNIAIREGFGFKAQSTFQADLFDLIIQETNTIKQLTGRRPMVVVVIPWLAGHMGPTRHNRMVGLVDALGVVGIKALGVDLYNLFGGGSFRGDDPEDITDWVNAGSFRLDGDGDPLGTGVHPKDQPSARIAAYGIWRCIEAAAASGNTPREPAARRGTVRSHGAIKTRHQDAARGD